MKKLNDIQIEGIEVLSNLANINKSTEMNNLFNNLIIIISKDNLTSFDNYYLLKSYNIFVKFVDYFSNDDFHYNFTNDAFNAYQSLLFIKINFKVIFEDEGE